MTDYQQGIFSGIEDKMETGKWYQILPTRPDYPDFCEAIKLRIELKGDCEFSDDYSLFRKTRTFNQVLEDFNKKTDWMPAIHALHGNIKARLEKEFPSQWKKY